MSEQEHNDAVIETEEISDEEIDQPRKKGAESASSDDYTSESENEVESRDDEQRNGIHDESRSTEKPVDLDKDTEEATKKDQPVNDDEKDSGSSDSETDSESETDSDSYTDSESSDSER